MRREIRTIIDIAIPTETLKRWIERRRCPVTSVSERIELLLSFSLYLFFFFHLIPRTSSTFALSFHRWKMHAVTQVLRIETRELTREKRDTAARKYSKLFVWALRLCSSLFFISFFFFPFPASNHVDVFASIFHSVERRSSRLDSSVYFFFLFHPFFSFLFFSFPIRKNVLNRPLL